MLNIDGLVTGLDTQTIIDGLLAVQQSQIDRMTFSRDEIETERAAFSSLRGTLSTLQNEVLKLGRSNGEIFNAKLATTSDEEIVNVSASDDAAVGTYSLRVKSLAHAHQVSSQGFESDTALIGQGELSFQVGDREVTSVTIDDSNNTLQGLADTINQNSRDVTAAVINTGSDDSEAFRLLLTSQHTGAANEINVTGELSSDEGVASPAFDLTVQKATNAEVQFGSSDPDDPEASAPIVATSDTSTMEDVIPGVTLDLRKADVDQEINISIQNDSEAIRSALSGFVDSFNAVSQFINENSKYDSDTQTAGLFLGNRDASSIQSSLRNTVSSVMRGISSEMNRLSAVGISFGEGGLLKFDSKRLNEVLDGTNDRASLDDVRRLFSVDGQVAGSGIEFISGTHDTHESNFDEVTGSFESIGVDITSAARRAVLSAETSATNVTIDDTNNTLDMTIDGVDLSLQLSNGDYTPEELIAHVTGAVNGHTDIGGRELIAEIVDGNVQLTSASYGSLSEVSVKVAEENSAHSLLGFDGGTSALGTNVSGLFVLPDGSTEQATGSGRLLSGKDENDVTKGLRLRVTMSQEDIEVGRDAELTITRGIAGKLDVALRSMLEGEFSNFDRIEDTFDERVQSIDDSIDRLNKRFESREAQIVAQFASLEVAVSELQSVGQALGSSLASLPTPTG